MATQVKQNGAKFMLLFFPFHFKSSPGSSNKSLCHLCWLLEAGGQDLGQPLSIHHSSVLLQLWNKREEMKLLLWRVDSVVIVAGDGSICQQA